MRAAAFGPDAESGQRRFAGGLRDALGARRARELGHIEDLRSAASPDAQTLRTARSAGAKYAAVELHGPLQDDWIMFRGYHNDGGEIPQLLLGPQGLVAMSSLSLNATVHCRGDKWHADRFDKFEQFLGQMSLDDRDGRSPSTQLNQPADALEAILRSAGHEIGVLRAVLLNHPRSRQGNWHRPTVHIFTSSSDLVSWLHKMPKVINRGDKHKIEDLITHRVTDDVQHRR